MQHNTIKTEEEFREDKLLMIYEIIKQFENLSHLLSLLDKCENKDEVAFTRNLITHNIIFLNMVYKNHTNIEKNIKSLVLTKKLQNIMDCEDIQCFRKFTKEIADFYKEIYETI